MTKSLKCISVFAFVLVLLLVMSYNSNNNNTTVNGNIISKLDFVLTNIKD